MSLAGVPWFLDYSPVDLHSMQECTFLRHILRRLYTFATPRAGRGALHRAGDWLALAKKWPAEPKLAKSRPVER